MNLNSNSWHFRLVKHVLPSSSFDIRWRGQVSLCNYFWLVAWAMFVTTLMTCVAVGMVSGAVWLMVCAPLVWLFTGALADAAFVGAVIWGGMVFAILADYIERKLSERGHRIVHKKPNLLVEYVKAKKAKVCPILKVE